MIQIPEVGFSRSATRSNVEANSLADWLEATTLFDDPEVSKSDVVDALIEHQICTDDEQDIAHDIASDGWTELLRRRRWGGLPSTMYITNSRVSVSHRWEDEPMRAFFVLLSALRIYPDWAKDFREYTVQGNLFERVVEQICPAIFPGWSVYRTGWCPDETKDIPTIISDLRSRIFVSGAPDLERWLAPNEKDGGLDIVCYRAFEDEREALPVFFLQCASGGNWRQKVDTPSADRWCKLLHSAVAPTTGIVAPSIIEDKDLRIAALTGQTVVFDRLRLLSAAKEHGVELMLDLREELSTWMRPRVDGLPRAD